MRKRRFGIGAEVLREGGCHFRVWAPKCKRVEVVVESSPRRAAVTLAPEAGGYFAGVVSPARPGTLYRFRLDGDGVHPDPASRFQPQGPHGPSEVIDPAAFAWSDEGWKGVERDGQVIYEMHVGTFTPEGVWESARQRLPELAAAGITVLEIMPVADFVGEFGWGYDGVNLFAPYHVYGRPDDFRRFVDSAHAVGLGVILDVVYNHFGPDGNYLRPFADEYFTDRYVNEWGDAINFDGPDSGQVRQFFVANAVYWIDEFHLDGLRLDATQQIFDASAEHILAEMSRTVREAAPQRAIYLVAENERQEGRLARGLDVGGYGIDALWNDDFHHTAVVAATGQREAYYTDHHGLPQEFISAAKWGYLFQGQRYAWQKAPRGTPVFDLEPSHFIAFLENHDQTANSGRGQRLWQRTSPGRFRALTALLLLGPATPMLFQGQEFGSSRPFHYFADHKPELAQLVQQGRTKFMEQFQSLAHCGAPDKIPDCGARSTFERCKLDRTERRSNSGTLLLHRDLLQLRREDPVFRRSRRGGIDGAVLGPDCFVLRYFGAPNDDRLLIVNLGRHLSLPHVPEPLMAPPRGRKWTVLFASEEWQYGGGGYAPLESEESGWQIPAEAAFALAPCLTPSDPELVDPVTEIAHG